MNSDRALTRALEIEAMSWDNSADEASNDRMVTVSEVHKLIAIALDCFRDTLAKELEPGKRAACIKAEKRQEQAVRDIQAERGGQR